LISSIHHRSILKAQTAAAIAVIPFAAIDAEIKKEVFARFAGNCLRTLAACCQAAPMELKYQPTQTTEAAIIDPFRLPS
jgi:hypothetical protein